MKLYATVTSDRASKGQGGNSRLEIELTIDPVERKEVGRVIMDYTDNIYSIYYYPINTNCQDQKLNSGRVLLYQQTKGKKPKTEKVVHKCFIEHTSGQYASLSIPHYHE